MGLLCRAAKPLSSASVWFLAMLALTAPAHAQAVYHWTGGSGNPDITLTENWDSFWPPNITTNPATDELHFGPATYTVVTSAVQLFIDQMIYDAGAPAYTVTNSTDQADFAFVGGPNKLLVNNSSVVQPILAQLNLAEATVKTPGAGFTFGDGSEWSYVYANAAVGFWLTHDVICNAKQLQVGARNVYGANGPDTTISDPAGTLILNVDSGTGSTNKTNFTGRVNIWSGAVRVGASNALGLSSSTSNTYVHGDYVEGEYGFGRLEVYNNIVLSERIRIDGRTAETIADFDHIVNYSDDNTITNINQIGGAGHFNIASNAGKLTVTCALGSSDAGEKLWTFRGAGDIDMTGDITGGNGLTSVRKQGAGTLTLSGAANSFDGPTTVEGGTLNILSSLPTETTVKGGATLAGSGSVLANLIAESGSTVAPGSGVGTLSITGNATLGGTLNVQYEGDTDTVDLLDVMGDLDLTGATFQFSDSGAAALDGGVYVFATYGALTGEPAAYVGLPEGWQVQYGYSGGHNIALIVPGGVQIPGDTDGNQIVDATDAAALAAHWGATSGASREDGDFNGDGAVNAADASILAANWGDHRGESAASVPEPSWVVLLATFMTALAARRRR